MRITILLLSLLFFTNVSNAQYYDSSPSIVLGVGGAIPLGDLGTRQGIGGVLNGQLRLPAGLMSDVILTGSVAAFKGKTYTQPVTNKKVTSGLGAMISGFVGYRYYLNPLSDYNSFYLQGDAGLTARSLKSINLAIVPSLGYLMNDKLDLSLKYQKIFISSSDFSFISLGIAYGFNFN